MNAGELAALLAPRITGVVGSDVLLAPHTTYRLGGTAALYIEPADVDDLAALGEVITDTAEPVPVLVLGRGSNLVISDAGWPGVVVKLGAAFSYVQASESGSGLRAGGATPLPLLANWAARRGLAGMEFAIAIPGSVGGAVRMDAGAHGREIRDCLVAVDVWDLARGDRSTLLPDDLDFDYRSSNLTDDQLVVAASFGLERGEPSEVRARMESYRRHRAETQPGAAQNAGSVFRNPPGDHAGRLVEAAGLKGFTVGGARVSELHANFFIAEDGATAQDVYELVGRVIDKVRDTHGVELVPEIRFVGAFNDLLREGSTR